MKETIHLLHTNDIHSHIEKWPKIRRWLNEETKKYENQGNNVFRFDVGDFLDRVHPLTEATDGTANVTLMNQVHYDAVTIGNNEGITNSQPVLNHLYEQANFPVVLSNLKDKSTNDYPTWAKPYTMIETTHQMKIGVFGLTAPMALSYDPFGWHVIDPFVAAKQMIDELSEKTDAIILLSHLGINDDKKMANLYPQIDIILGSHTHHLLPTGLIENGVLLCAAGKFGEYVGDVSLECLNKKIIKKTAKTIDIKLLSQDIADINEITSYKNQGDKLLEGRHVANVTSKLNKTDYLITTTLSAMKESSGCDVAIVNSGLFLTDLGPGEITEKDLHDCLPHPMNLIKVTLQGKDLIRLAKEVVKNRDFLRKFPIVGMKFRGKYFGEVWYDGFNYNEETHEGFWLGKPIEMDKYYSFVTVDHLAFVPFFPTIEIAGKIEILGPSFLRNSVAMYLNKQNDD
ncbi:bifunctional metallophosphatase/5'-nucleotidase [Vagococcus bubulae]|uniref:Multifunctional 2',3'-cyclic-nucleotide 2'-phosphodiesterase/5'-nucleotidase/3'-nucleotidase n=1 Tax=Vagococcus bubulae TaxID=1977868 RepID=A0A429ZKQ7_9ENTE|nr:bifunctional UDP-sugar hydrolase/5'-nucleotidase [Vagococcus bubulae]RST94261.1 hypothetical protein CBF36_06390 [Vagococcus bubulae]